MIPNRSRIKCGIVMRNFGNASVRRSGFPFWLAARNSCWIWRTHHCSLLTWLTPRCGCRIYFHGPWRAAHVPTSYADHFVNQFLCQSGMPLFDLASNCCPTYLDNQGTNERPWGLVVAFDEFTPGNVVKTTANKRKSMALYYTFLQFGDYTRNQLAWFCPMVLRTTKAKRLKGQWSHALSAFLELALLDKHAGMDCAGVALDIRGSTVVVWAKLKFTLTDGDGFAQAFFWKGASSTKPCIKCWNVLMKSAKVAPPHVALHDVSGFQQTTHQGTIHIIESLAAAKERVQRKEITTTSVEKLETKCGFRACQFSVLANVRVRTCFSFPHVVYYDWMRIFLQDGILNVEFAAFFTTCIKFGIEEARLDRLDEFLIMKNWEYPHRVDHFSASVVADLCQGKSTVSMRCAASTLLTAFVVLRFYCDTEIPADPRIKMHRTSLRLACSMVTTITECKARLLSKGAAAEQLQKQWEVRTQAHKCAYAQRFLKPKFHWASHLPPQFEALLDMFVVERMNKKAKAAAQACDKGTRYEKSVVQRYMKNHLGRLDACGPFGASKLQGAISNDDRHPGCNCARFILDEFGEKFTIGDVVFSTSGALGKIVQCCERGGDHFVSVQVMRSLGEIAYRSWACIATDVLVSWPLGAFFAAASWHVIRADDRWVVLR